MSSYKIKPYTLEKAKTLGVEVKPSRDKRKKIDVFRNGNLLFSIGAVGYSDFPTYIQEKGLEYARERRRLYWIRHRKDDIPNTAGWYALRLLW